ncbi:hypothetical protein EDB19DRAFT_1768209 [Suillus lakei]|nr:hypothetical protein EDB19DRAFT_1768209 [Suillus lakei]
MAKGYWQHVHHYLNKGDAKSTSNMVKHIKSCWGNIAYEAAQEAKTAASACESIINNILKTGSITTLFERKGKGKVKQIQGPSSCDGLQRACAHLQQSRIKALCH